MYLIFLIGGLLTVIGDLMLGSYVLLGLGLAGILAGSLGWAFELTLPWLTLVFVAGAVVFIKATLNLKRNSVDSDVNAAIESASAGQVVNVLSRNPLKVQYRGVPYDAKLVDGMIDENVTHLEVVREDGLFVLVKIQGEK